MSRTVRIARAITSEAAKNGPDSARRHLAIKLEADEFVVPPSKPGPEGWLETYKGIQKMRATSPPAPVDLMGCASLHDPKGDPKINRFQILVGLMLSSMTKDAVTAAAFKRLDETLPGGLTVSSVASASQSTLEQLILPVGFFRKKSESTLTRLRFTRRKEGLLPVNHRTRTYWKVTGKKTRYLIATSKILQTKYNGDIPPTLKEICSLPGVGPKMGHLCMQVAWGKVQGIGVDVHMHRIFNRLGWVKTKTPEETRVAMEEWLPFEYWGKINGLVVGFGQTRCSAVKPKCEGCLVRERCPFGRSQASVKVKTEKLKNPEMKLKVETESESVHIKQEVGAQQVKLEIEEKESKLNVKKKRSGEMVAGAKKRRTMSQLKAQEMGSEKEAIKLEERETQRDRKLKSEVKVKLEPAD